LQVAWLKERALKIRIVVATIYVFHKTVEA
jgi:hypothetical protein